MDFLNSCPNFIQEVIIIFGLAAVSMCFFISLVAIWNGIDKGFKRLVYYIQRKTRFNKPPLAKCYCRDCEHWNSNGDENGKCWQHYGWVTADNWFCWDAEPRKEERSDI